MLMGYAVGPTERSAPQHICALFQSWMEGALEMGSAPLCCTARSRRMHRSRPVSRSRWAERLGSLGDVWHIMWDFEIKMGGIFVKSAKFGTKVGEMAGDFVVCVSRPRQW